MALSAGVNSSGGGTTDREMSVTKAMECGLVKRGACWQAMSHQCHKRRIKWKSFFCCFLRSFDFQLKPCSSLRCVETAVRGVPKSFHSELCEYYCPHVIAFKWCCRRQSSAKESYDSQDGNTKLLPFHFRILLNNCPPIFYFQNELSE